MIYLFDAHSLDTERRELRRGRDIVAIEPQVFDILQFLIGRRERVVSKDELLATVWGGRIVSESTLSSRIAALRRAVGDSGQQQRLIRTLARKGFRFVGAVREATGPDERPQADDIHRPPPEEAFAAGLTLPQREQDGALAPNARAAFPERRPVTIMACAVDAAMGLASRLDPEDLAEVMTECRGCFTQVVERFAGFVARHTDDGVLA